MLVILSFFNNRVLIAVCMCIWGQVATHTYHLVIIHSDIQMSWKLLENWVSNTGSATVFLYSVKPVFLAAKGRWQPLLATLKGNMIMYRRALRKAYSTKQSTTRISQIVYVTAYHTCSCEISIRWFLWLRKSAERKVLIYLWRQARQTRCSHFTPSSPRYVDLESGSFIVNS